MEFGRRICSTLGVLWHNPFAPVRKMPTTPWENGRELLHIPYAETSENQYLDLYLPDCSEKLPLLVLIHGGGFVFGDSQTRQVQWMYRYFRQHGYVCASVNYRLAQEAPWPAAIEDVKAAIRYLRANADGYGIDAGRIAVWGESAGGYLAAMAAVSEDDTFNEMLGTGGSTFALNAPDIGGSHFHGEIGVLGEIFKIPATQGRTLHV